MQASIQCPVVQEQLDIHSDLDSNGNAPSVELAPDESYQPFIPYTLDIQQEDNLSIDMIKLYQELLPNKESNDRRTQFVQSMEKIMNKEWPDNDIRAHVFGSSVNDLGTSSSDVDLCITTPWNGLRNVRVLAKLFRGMQHVVCVPRAKVPIVRLFDPELQLSCDINVNNTLALQNTKMIKTYVALDPRVRPLIMIVKHWTKERLLNDAANGGTLSSYTWTCMIINFLQQRRPPVLPVLHNIESEGKDDAYFYEDVNKLKDFGAANTESLGGLLYAFFRRFAVEFSYDEQVVSVRQGCYLSKVEKGWDTGRNKMSLCVEEPFNVSRNLGNSADVASVLGLRCEFQRFLDLLIAGEELKAICTPYLPVSSKTSTEIPTNNNNNTNNNTLTLTLPAENRTSSFFLPIYPYPEYSNTHSNQNTTTAHPCDRRRSMVDGICSYPTLTDHVQHPNHSTSYTYRAPPIPKPYNTSFNTFHPRFSSSQALDTILSVRNTRHGSHPLPPVPSTLLSMLNINANSADQTVDNIFARYNRKQTPTPPQRLNEIKNVKKNANNTYRRKGTHHPHYGNNNSNNNSKSNEVKRGSNNNTRRRSSNGAIMDWPTISTSASTPQPNVESSSSSGTDEPQRSRRWSTTKQHEEQQQLQQRKKTLAEIVKIAIPPSIKLKSAPSSPIPSASTSSNKSKQRRQKSGGKSSGNSNNATRQKKKSPRA